MTASGPIQTPGVRNLGLNKLSGGFCADKGLGMTGLELLLPSSFSTATLSNHLVDINREQLHARLYNDTACALQPHDFWESRRWPVPYSVGSGRWLSGAGTGETAGEGGHTFQRLLHARLLRRAAQPWLILSSASCRFREVAPRGLNSQADSSR